MGISALAVLALCAARPARAIAARILVSAPNAKVGPAPAPMPGELRIAVGPPDATLAIRVLEPAGFVRGTVFFLHGIRDRSESLSPWAETFAGRGYRAVLVDLRGHGRSSGSFLTYGVVESRDLQQVADALSERLPSLGPIGAFGFSYGAAVGLQWAARDPRVRAVVAVAPFTSLREVIRPGYAPAFLPDSFVRGAIDEGGALAGFDPDAASPLQAIADTNAPILLVHGRLDRNIPPSHSERLREAAGKRAELLIVEGAHHEDVLALDGSRIVDRADSLYSTAFSAALPTR